MTMGSFLFYTTSIQSVEENCTHDHSYVKNTSVTQIPVIDHSKARQGRIQDFKLGGGGLKKIAPSGGTRENLWGISCEKSRFYTKKSYFFQI